MKDTRYDSTEKTSTVYATTDATFIDMDFPAGMETLPGSVMRFGKTFHRLTPEYWAWFYYKYTLMEKALTNGKISEATFVEILDRISKLYNHALALFGKMALDEACETADIKGLDEIIRRENAGIKRTEKTVIPSLVVERGNTGSEGRE